MAQGRILPLLRRPLGAAGGLFLLVGAVFLLLDGIAFATRGEGPLALGMLWYLLDPGSLNVAQAVVQRYLSPVLWDPLIVSVLLLPVALLAGALGAGLLLLAALRRRD